MYSMICFIMVNTSSNSYLMDDMMVFKILKNALNGG